MLVFPVYEWHFRLPGGSFHDYVPPPPGPPPLPFLPPAFPGPFGNPWCVNIEAPHPMHWINPLQHKLALRTLADGNRMAQQNHDAGMMIPHAPVPMNAGLALTLLFSKYKVMFGASTVEVEGKPVGTVFPVLAFCMYCAQPMAMPAPLGPHMLVPFPCTVRVGMTAMDFVSGFFHVLVDMAFDLFFNFLSIQERHLKDIFQSVLGGKFIAICFAFIFTNPTSNKVYTFLSFLKPALRETALFKKLGNIGGRIAEKAVRDFIKKLVTDTAHTGAPKGSFPVIGGDVPRAIKGIQSMFSPSNDASAPAAGAREFDSMLVGDAPHAD